MTVTKSPYGAKGPLILGLTWAAAILATILVLLRAFFASSRNGRLRWDFVYVSIGLGFGLACQVVLTSDVLHGAGNHIYNISFADALTVLELTYVGILLGLAAGNFSKLSVVALLLQVTPDIDSPRRLSLWTLAILMTGSYFGQEMIILFQCRPFTHLWHPSTPGVCPGEKISDSYSYFQGTVAVIGDLFLALYPTTILWGLRMSRRKKIAICVVMAGGVFTAAISLSRIVFEYRLFVGFDAPYEYSPFIICAMLEMWFVIILGSLPPLRAFFERVIWPNRQVGDTEGASLGLQTIGSQRKKVPTVQTVQEVDDP